MRKAKIITIEDLGEVTNLLKNADSAAFSLEASLRAANREFSNIGSAQSWAATIDRMAAKLRIYSKSELKLATASTIDMTKRLGLSAEQMETLILRTADLSAGKTDLNGGIERVTAAMRGEAEASEYLGLTLNENYVKAWHEAHNATGKAWKDLTDLEKAQVRYNVFLEQANPLTGKAADSITTMAGAYALAASKIHDAVSENKNAVAATKELATVIAEHADEIGELATKLINAATSTMQFVLNNKEAIAIIGGLTLGAGAAATAISWMTTIWQGLNTAMLVMTGSKVIPWLGSLATGIKTVNLAALSLKGVLGSVSGLFLAWQAGWQIGTWLNKFAVVQKAGVGLAYICLLLELRRMRRRLQAWGAALYLAKLTFFSMLLPITQGCSPFSGFRIVAPSLRAFSSSLLKYRACARQFSGVHVGILVLKNRKGRPWRGAAFRASVGSPWISG